MDCTTRAILLSRPFQGEGLSGYRCKVHLPARNESIFCFRQLALHYSPAPSLPMESVGQPRLAASANVRSSSETGWR